ncbi:MAG: transporter [Cyanobacteria bacterium QS_8_64_29]|nr:MAG: transporter [Cyanobacteria bacterium QS_8_64_29]
MPALLVLYWQLAGGVLAGVVLGRLLPARVPATLGRFLFWVGVPVGIVAFLRRADLSGAVWLAPLLAWGAVLAGALLATALGRLQPQSLPPAARGSFFLTAMLGNTGYMGYPVNLALAGERFFGWAVFFDLGMVLSSYGLGVLLAAYWGRQATGYRQLARAIVTTPALWGVGLGLLLRPIALPPLAQAALQGAGWSAIGGALLLIGMRLSQLSSWHRWRLAAASLSVKMLLVPLLLGSLLGLSGMTGLQRLAMVLQAGMPPAFATLVITEAYELDRELTVTAIAAGSGSLLLTLPLWLLLFGGG